MEQSILIFVRSNNVGKQKKHYLFHNSNLFKFVFKYLFIYLNFVRLECIWICKYIIKNDIMDFYPDVNKQEIGISISEMNLSD